VEICPEVNVTSFLVLRPTPVHSGLVFERVSRTGFEIVSRPEFCYCFGVRRLMSAIDGRIDFRFHYTFI
jgi:hypothetical protein